VANLHILHYVVLIQQHHQTRSSAIAGGRTRHLSNPATTKISLENWSPRPVVWHYMRDSTFIHFDTIPKCDRHTQTDGQTHDDGIYRT